MLRKTRSELDCPIFGAPKCISENVLPTYEDMNSYFDWVESINPQQTATEATKVVAKKLQKFGTKLRFPLYFHALLLNV